MRKPAFIFDMDGTIVDNMAFHTKSWLEFFERRGQVYDADAFFRETAGAQGREILRARLAPEVTDADIAALALEKDQLYREMYGPHRGAIAASRRSSRPRAQRACSWPWPRRRRP